MSYQELLKDPRWQKRRLEIMERDKWTCQRCKDKESTLTVHHKSYKKVNGSFVDPWDYCDNDLITLCDDCHQKEEKELDEEKKNIYFTLLDKCDSAQSLKALNVLLDAMYKLFGCRINSAHIYLAYFCLENTVEASKVVDSFMSCFEVGGHDEN